MEQILVTSGLPPYSIERLEQYWYVTDIVNQREALEYLKTCEEAPAAIMIGNVGKTGVSDLSARQMLEGIQAINAAIPVIVSTSQVEMSDIVDLVRRGAFDYIQEPSHSDTHGIVGYTEALTLALQRAVERSLLLQENQRLRDEAISTNLPPDFVGRSRPIKRILKLITKAAPTPATILMTGETGTGKELLSRTLHQISPRRVQPFVPVNCGALSETLLASELFGHVKGAFTGAIQDKIGLLLEAGEGTLFLDEIGTITPRFQVMLLRVLENRTARPVGGSSDYPVKCRFVAAANQDLNKLVEEGGFREDLLYRLNMFHLEIPPLRQRQEDIPALVIHFVNRIADEYRMESPRVSAAAMSLLEKSDWPGNVRQLRNAVERAMILCDDGILDVEHFNLSRKSSADLTWREGLTYDEAMRSAETQLLKSTLAAARGNQSQAARLLDMRRTTLAYRLKQLGIS